MEPPKLNILGGDFAVAGAAAGATAAGPKEKALLGAGLLLAAAPPVVVSVVVLLPPPKLKAGAAVVAVAVVVFDPANWKLGAVLAATDLLTPKLKASAGAVTELEVEAAVDVGPGPNVRVFAVVGLSGCCDPPDPPTPKLKGATVAVEDVETAGRLLEGVEAAVVEAGRLKVTVAVFTEVAGFVVSDEEGGEEMVPNEKGVDVVEVTELSEAVGTEVATAV